MNLKPSLVVLFSVTAILAHNTPPVSAPRQPRIQVIQHLDLGDLLLEDLGGSVALTERNEFESYGGSVRPSLRSTTHEARILLTGTPKAPFTLVIDPSQPLLENGRGSYVRVASFVHETGARQGFLNDQGEAEVRLGARLDIPAGLPPGLYAQSHLRLSLSVMDAAPQVVTEFFAIRCNLRPMLHLSTVSALEFGTIIPGDATGTFRVDPDGKTSVSGASGIRQYHGVPVAAEFLVTGTAGTEYSIDLPARVLLRGPGKDMDVHGFETNLPRLGVVPRGGFTFRVGASLTVPADQLPGRYEGVFLVAISYP
jgi:hypothetical protein